MTTAQREGGRVSMQGFREAGTDAGPAREERTSHCFHGFTQSPTEYVQSSPRSQQQQLEVTAVSQEACRRSAQFFFFFSVHEIPPVGLA